LAAPVAGGAAAYPPDCKNPHVMNGQFSTSGKEPAMSGFNGLAWDESGARH
jgi:hypothetical protein